MKLSSIISYISKSARKAGEQTIYAVLLLYHAYRREETPFWARNIIMASIAYFLAPFDTIPDLTPFLGYTDDLSVMMFGLVSIACFINEDVRGNARKSLGSIIKNYNEALLDEVDQKL